MSHSDPVRLAWIHADLLIELARLRELDGDRACARLDADAAIAALRRLDVVVPDGATELLTRLASRSPGSSADVATLKREGKWWDAAHRGARVRLHDSKGLAYVADLIANPGAERHALDLVDRVEGVDPGGLDRRALGDAGELLDTQARTAYRHRIEALRLEADEAIEAGMLERAEAIQDELDQLVAQLAAAFGLGGRDRRASSAAERARLNVTRAVRAAIAKVTEALPAAGAALAAVEVVRAEPGRGLRALDIAARLSSALKLPAPAGAVLSVPMSGPREALTAQERLRDAGFLVGCFRPPSVPDGVSRLRLTAKADLAEDEVERLLAVLSTSVVTR